MIIVAAAGTEGGNVGAPAGGVDEDLKQLAGDWLATLAETVGGRDAGRVAELVQPDGSWRDVLALTGSLRTADGRDKVRALLGEVYERRPAPHFRLDGPPTVTRARRWGVQLVEVGFDFTTELGRGRGLVRLTPMADGPGGLGAWTVLTALEELTSGVAPSALPAAAGDETMNWLDRRVAQLDYGDREPTVLVVGAGQCGLSAAARLKALGIDALVVERWPRIGDSWRRRYHSLRLHNETPANHLPYLRFPDSWPEYIPKDKLANWFEFYADALELNVWTSATFVSASYDDGARRWEAVVDRDGRQRVLRPSHIVVATGATGGIPRYPHIDGLDAFGGRVLHSSSYEDGEEFRGRDVLVVGAGSSGHDVALDLHRYGATVTMMQRSPTTVTSLVPACQRHHEPYRGTATTDDLDFVTLSTTYPMKVRYLKHIAELCQALDKDLLDGLHAAGLTTDYGEDGTGHPLKFMRRGGGYYLDVGCSQLIVDRKIAIVQAADTTRFTPTGLLFADGSERHFDAVVLATGYENTQELARKLFGSEIADAIGPIWGLDDEGELRNICRTTAQDGLWFLAGSFIDARTMSKYLALQIQAAEQGSPVSTPRRGQAGEVETTP